MPPQFSVKTATRFAEFASAALAPLLDEPGIILQSSAETLKPGELYLLGLNPRGGAQPLRQHLLDLPNRERHWYEDGKWKKHPAGQAPLQRRVRWLVEQLGYDLRQVCASNLIFTPSRDATSCGYPSRADECWPVHEEILRIVRPCCILAHGNSGISPYRYLRDKFLPKELRKKCQSRFSAGHGSWRCRCFHMKLHDKRVLVVGLPHLSRYEIEGKHQVIARIAELLR